MNSPGYFKMDSVVRRCRCRVPLSESLRQFLAEMMGTFILVTIGVGSVAQSFLSKGEKGGFLSINFGWGLGVTFGVYWSAGISGGHINPAVSLAMTIAGKLPLRKLPLYWLAQSLGAFIASAVCFGLYRDLLNAYDNGNRTIESAGIWSTYPSAGVSHGTIFGDQLIGTAILVGTVFILTDKRNTSAPNAGLLPVAIGFVVLAIGASFGINCGYGINPARDLIPRIFTAIAGWKSLPFTTNGNFFWIPVIGQLCAAIICGTVAFVLADVDEEEVDENTPLVHSQERGNTSI